MGFVSPNADTWAAAVAENDMREPWFASPGSAKAVIASLARAGMSTRGADVEIAVAPKSKAGSGSYGRPAMPHVRSTTPGIVPRMGSTRSPSHARRMLLLVSMELASAGVMSAAMTQAADTLGRE